MNYVLLYADHLYKKGDYGLAIEEYKKTLRSKNIEPSYVIRKFLDAQKIENLTDYLEALHDEGCPNPDHTTLLLNCYTKLKKENQVHKFIVCLWKNTKI